MRDMGDDYNHSTFIDLVLSGLFGLRARAWRVSNSQQELAFCRLPPHASLLAARRRASHTMMAWPRSAD